jgi:hypothetical protein
MIFGCFGFVNLGLMLTEIGTRHCGFSLQFLWDGFIEFWGLCIVDGCLCLAGCVCVCVCQRWLWFG